LTLKCRNALDFDFTALTYTCCLLWFYRSDWQNSQQFLLASLKPLNPSDFEASSSPDLKSDRVNLAAPASPIECLLYLPNVWATQHKLGPERLTRLGNSNVLRPPVYLELRLQPRNIYLVLELFVWLHVFNWRPGLERLIKLSNEGIWAR